MSPNGEGGALRNFTRKIQQVLKVSIASSEAGRDQRCYQGDHCKAPKSISVARLRPTAIRDGTKYDISFPVAAVCLVFIVMLMITQSLIALLVWHGKFRHWVLRSTVSRSSGSTLSVSRCIDDRRDVRHRLAGRWSDSHKPPFGVPVRGGRR